MEILDPCWGRGCVAPRRTAPKRPGAETSRSSSSKGSFPTTHRRIACGT